MLKINKKIRYHKSETVRDVKEEKEGLKADKKG
jgi:hypothetical protein